MLRHIGCNIVIGSVILIGLVACQSSNPLPPTPALDVSPTPEFMRWSTLDAEEAIVAAGLEFEDPHPMTVDEFGFAPQVSEEGIRFLVPSLCSDCGGRLYSFASKDDLQAMESYYDELGRSSANFFSWLFIKDNILIQINGNLPEEIARQYEAALNTME